MKILFLCGSLEPGRDGVGDYTRRLAGELLRQGHGTAIIGMNDQFVKNVAKGVFEQDHTELKYLRLPSVLDIQTRFDIAGRWVNEFDPEWISLQFVPFAFHPKGLTYGMTNHLKMLGKGRKWHILFHELWLGMHAGASKKESLWGFVQRRMILSLIRSLKPKRMHTQSSLYKRKLSDAGVSADLLPLFSNIPVYRTGPEEQKKAEGNEMVFVLFGEVHDTGAPVEQFAAEVKDYAVQKGMHPALMILGRSGKQQEYWKHIWESQGMEVRVLGELSAEQISIHLQQATYGITTTVYGKVEKSGSVAAMLEHGLNIVCVAGDWKPKGMTATDRIPGVTEYKTGELASFFTPLHEENTFCKIEDAARKLTASFESINQ